MRRWHFGDEKLRAIGVGTGVGIGQPAGHIEFHVGKLICHLEAGAAGAIAQRIPALNHEIRDHAMKDGAIVERLIAHHFAGLGILPFFGAGRQADKVGYAIG